MIRVLLSFCFIWEDIFIKHLRQCFISCPSTLNFIKNTLLQIVFQLSSHCVETLSHVLDILLQVPYHCFCRYATLENKTPAATFPKFCFRKSCIKKKNRGKPSTSRSFVPLLQKLNLHPFHFSNTLRCFTVSILSVQPIRKNLVSAAVTEQTALRTASYQIQQSAP